jgi:hypothetical protein
MNRAIPIAVSVTFAALLSGSSSSGERGFDRIER